MPQYTFIGAALAVGVALLAPRVAHAEGLTYKIESAFNDGGSVSGVFSFDPSTYDPAKRIQPFATNWNFVTTAGAILPGATYAPADGFMNLYEDFLSGGPIYNLAFVSVKGIDQTDLYLAFSPVSFNELLAGQAVVPLTTGSGGISSLECAECNPYRLMDAGASVALVPEPATWVLTLLGFGLLEGFQAKWLPVRVKKTRKNKKQEPRSDSIGSEKAFGLRGKNHLSASLDKPARKGQTILEPCFIDRA